MNDETYNLFETPASRRLAEISERASAQLESVRDNIARPRVEGILAIEQAIRDTPEDIAGIPPVASILAQRQTTHGEFADDASASQEIKDVLHMGKNWLDMTPVQREALENIATKIGRILSGDRNHKDHWSDIQGYARLVEERL
jgi:hypothetical protein